MTTVSVSGSRARKAVRPWDSDELWCDLQDELPEYARCHLDAARAGDPDAAARPCAAAPNEYRGLIAVAAYWSGVPNPAYREIMRAVWNHDHNYLMAATKNDRRLIRRMLRAAEFDHPFSGSITVFRGTSGVSPTRASKGLSWTASRDVACWFAHWFPNRGQPIVLKATVRATDVVFWDDTRSEQEVIFREPVPFELDPDPDTWFQAAEGLRRRRKREQAARLRKLQRTRAAGSPSAAAASRRFEMPLSVTHEVTPD
jgi:hypothetical protein